MSDGGRESIFAAEYRSTSSGVVLASYGRGVLVEADDAASGDATLRCSLKGRKQRIVCGDRITWTYQPAHDGPSVESIERRRNLIERIDTRGRALGEGITRLAALAVTSAGNRCGGARRRPNRAQPNALAAER